VIERLRRVVERFRPPLERIGLPAWFIAVDLLWIAKPEVLGFDARLYQQAATAWLAGDDPWAVAEQGVTYASGPHTLLFYAPTSLLPLEVSVAFWMVVGVAASVWLVRRLELPMWWVLFPPLVHAVWNGNPQSIALALLVLGGPVAAAVGVALKLYAAIPLLTKPRLLVGAAIALAVTLPILPWQPYIDSGFGVSDHIVTAWNGSAWRLPILLPPTVIALWILRHQGAEWLAVPAVWPATQFYYAAMALPALSPNARPGLPHRSLVTAALATPAPLIAPLVVLATAAWVTWRDRQGAGAWGRGISAPTSSTR
jgi:hypothetical protein